MDGKEYHFCFAYQGDRMRTFVFKDLRLQQAEGISADDGTQLVRISLCRRNGRREANIPRIIDEYNRRSGSQPIVPIVVDGNSKAIVCFKANQPVESNPILYRIDWEKSSKRYWRWDAPDPKTKPKHQTVLAGLEGLVRELNLNPNNLCMNSAYDVISKVSPHAGRNVCWDDPPRRRRIMRSKGSSSSSWGHSPPKTKISYCLN